LFGLKATHEFQPIEEADRIAQLTAQRDALRVQARSYLAARDALHLAESSLDFADLMTCYRDATDALRRMVAT
jgi:hypothetical protein